ncbi:Hypothetical predicted protein [Marmota monax]|uniref:Uncharacterized protein n=1 Tax=Marmota monax TaxID=9995 RepID=A0A5E4C3N0_MARMO|nr:Hypothetical predicted protein [Marmota monax]
MLLFFGSYSERRQEQVAVHLQCVGVPSAPPPHTPGISFTHLQSPDQSPPCHGVPKVPLGDTGEEAKCVPWGQRAVRGALALRASYSPEKAAGRWWLLHPWDRPPNRGGVGVDSSPGGPSPRTQPPSSVCEADLHKCLSPSRPGPAWGSSLGLQPGAGAQEALPHTPEGSPEAPGVSGTCPGIAPAARPAHPFLACPQGSVWRPRSAQATAPPPGWESREVQPQPGGHRPRWPRARSRPATGAASASCSAAVPVWSASGGERRICPAEEEGPRPPPLGAWMAGCGVSSWPLGQRRSQVSLVTATLEPMVSCVLCIPTRWAAGFTSHLPFSSAQAGPSGWEGWPLESGCCSRR